MKKIFKKEYLILVCVAVFLSFNLESHSGKGDESLKLAFITYNGFGNNLYIDNVTVGSRPANDVMVNYLRGIKTDTTFLPGKNVLKVEPALVVTNAGVNQVDSASFLAYLRIDELGIFDSAGIELALTGGVSTVITFDSVDIIAGIPFNVKTWITTASDTIYTNDTISFTSLYLNGFPRNVLIEGFTSATSPSAAANDPYLNFFVNENFENLTAIKYHRNVPEPGNDSMYLFNPDQSDSAKNFYNSFQVPNSIMNGERVLGVPYGTTSNLITPYENEIKKGSPALVNVTDTLVDGNINGSVFVNISHAVPPGDWRLKIMAVERYVFFDTIPQEWTQEEFFDVFRRAYPGYNGIEISVVPGQYNYDFSYPVESQWTDTLIYTVAFIQNVDTREILNSGKSISDTMFTVNTNTTFRYPDLTSKEYDHDGLNISGVNSFFRSSVIPAGDTTFTTGIFYLQNFEGGFLPYGWRKSAPVGFETFSEYIGVNGPSFPGNRSVIMPFYNYRNIGATDTLYTEIITGFNVSDSIRFNYAYAQFMNEYIDSLKVLASTDGGETFPFEIFNKGGSELATSQSTTIIFAPTGTNQWRTYTYPLTEIFTDDNTGGTSAQNYELYQNYPNPFNPATTINFFLPVQSKIRIDVYDISGRLITNLINEVRPGGNHQIVFDASNLASGVYFCKMTTARFSQTKKMVLVK